MARALGRTVRELLLTIDAAELEEWRLIYSENPWGERVDDQRAGEIAAAAANAGRLAAQAAGAASGVKITGEMWKPEDFFRSLRPKKRTRPTNEELSAKLRVWAMSMG